MVVGQRVAGVEDDVVKGRVHPDGQRPTRRGIGQPDAKMPVRVARGLEVAGVEHRAADEAWLPEVQRRAVHRQNGPRRQQVLEL